MSQSERPRGAIQVLRNRDWEEGEGDFQKDGYLLGVDEGDSECANPG